MKTMIGLVSDTHGLFDPKLERVFAGVAIILHAGDVCGEDVLDKLAAIAPSRAIRGNCDAGLPTGDLPEWRVEEVDGVRILVVHDLGKVDRPGAEVQKLIRAQRPHVVVAGHSHRGDLAELDGRLYVNPGSAGRKRFKLLRSVALLDIGPEGIEARLVSLESAEPEIVACATVRRLVTS